MLAGVGNKPQPYFQEDGENLQVFADWVWRIVKTHRMEAAMLGLQSDFQKLGEHLPDALLVVEADGRMAFANRAARKLLDKTSVSQLGKPFPLKLPEEDQVLEVELPLPGVSPVLVEMRTAAIIWTGKPARLVSLRDLTATRMLQNTLWERERQFQMLFESGVHGLLVLDPGKRILDLNMAAEHLFGLPRKEVIGRPAHDPIFMLIREDSSPLLQEECPWERVTVEGRPVTDVVIGIFNHREQGYHWVLASTNRQPLTESPSQERLFTTLVDFTDRRTLEGKLYRASKLEAVGQLAGGIAHDFNNLLQVIQGNLEFLADSLTEAPSTAREDLETIRQASIQAADLARRLLAFGGRQILQPRLLDLNEHLRNLMKTLQRLIGEHNQIFFQPASGLWPVFADPSQIDRILLNLCINARDAMPDGGHIEIIPGNVDIDQAFCSLHPLARSGRFVRLQVTDSGTGMGQEVLGRLFEPFFTTKERGSGTGLGLATVHGIVVQHKGFITVESALGSGTTFYVYFPRAEEGQAKIVRPAGERRKRGGQGILLVEDDEAIRKYAMRILREAGYKVILAVDGVEAQEILFVREKEISLVVLDVVMPWAGGKVVYSFIQANMPHIRVLFCSGYLGDAIHTDFIQAEGLELLPKPYRREDLLERVDRLLAEDAPAPKP
jgi:PAS domain S-box-containing protein